MTQLDLFGQEKKENIKGMYMKVDIDRKISDFANEIKKIFTAFSYIPTTSTLANICEYDHDIKPIIETIEIGAKQSFNWNYIHKEKEHQKAASTKNIIVCFSGGKDSTATAIKMKEMGWNVYLFYVKGINKSYPDEYTRAQTIAKYLNMPLCVIEVRQSGKTSFKDNPVKNQFIASLALDYAITNNIGVDVAFGDFTSDNIKNSCFNEDWSDCQEMWNKYIEYVRQWIPNANIHIPFKTYLETMDIIGNDEKLLNMVQGCVLPHRFRAMTKRMNEKKYGIKLLENRCGSCWKCCMEYIYYAESNIVKYDVDFYKHCLDVLVKKAKYLKPNINNTSLHAVYNAFLYKDFTETQYYKDVYETK